MEKLIMFIEKKFDNLKPLTQILLIGSIYGVMQLLIPVLLFDYSDELGVLWIILFVLYTAALVLSTAWIYHRKEVRNLEALYGTEFVFKAFPREKIRREKKAAREKRKAEKAHRKEIERRDLGLR